MNDRLREEVAAALDADPALAPYLPELLADLQELGSSAEVACEMLAPLGLAAGTTRVLDLGCGKGPIAIALAKHFGFRVLGVDGFAPFVEDARTASALEGVGHLCDFRHGDLREALDTKSPVNIVVMAALGRVLGDVRETAGQLRRAVRPGGYILVDDGFLADGHVIDQENYEGYLPHAQTIAAMEAFGDTVVKEVVYARDEQIVENMETTRLIRARAEALARKHPKDAEIILSYVTRQERECDILENDIIGATWLLRRGETLSPDDAVCKYREPLKGKP